MTDSESSSTPALQGRAAAVAAVGAALTWWLAMILQAPLAQDAGYPARATMVMATAMVVAVVGLRRGHPFDRLGPANLLTGGRTIVMALLAGVALGPGTPASGWLLVAIAAVGAAADTVDGPLARGSGMASRFGARFDMEVDALLIMVLAALAWRVVPMGAWILAAGLLRYTFIAAGWVLPWMRADLPPSRRRQTLCVVQIVSLIVSLAPVVSAAVATAVAAAGLMLLAWSFAVDVWWLATRSASAMS
jgi:phosphatidylglycerophosphate synthase